MNLFIRRNLSVNNYIRILDKIQEGNATISHWVQLSEAMITALPWDMLQQYPDDEDIKEAEMDEGLALVNSSKDPLDESMSAAEIEEEVLSYIALLHPQSAPPRGQQSLKEEIEQKLQRCVRTTKDRIQAFQALQAFTNSRFGNGSSGLQCEVKPDDDDITMGDSGVKVDSWRLANEWSMRCDTRTGDWDMDGIVSLEYAPGKFEVYGPRTLLGYER